jgi:hypothetical protein
MGLACPVQSRCSRLRLNINDVRCSMMDPQVAPQLSLCLARFRLSFASRTAEHSTDQLPLLSPPFLVLLLFRYLSPPERPMKIEVVVDPSRLAPTPSLASRVAPVETNAVVTNGTQTARSVAVAFWVSQVGLIDLIIRITGAVAHPEVVAEDQPLARPNDRKRPSKISMPRWRLVSGRQILCELY